MDDKNRDGIHVPPYDLHPEYEDLLKKVCDYCSSRFVIHLPPHISEAAVFKAFIQSSLTTAQFKTLVSRFKTDSKDKSAPIQIKMHTFAVSNTGGLRPERAKEIFTNAAEISGKSDSEYLREFVEYCKNHKVFKNSTFDKYGNQHRAFINKEKTIRMLLDSGFDSPGEVQPLSLQDSITIKNEIESIKKSINGYPYGKSKSFKPNSTNLEKAFLDVEQLLYAVPHNTDLLALKASLLIRRGQKEEAYKLSESLYHKAPKNLGVIVAHLAALRNAKEPQKALVIAQESKKQFPDSAFLAFQCGVCFEHLGQYREASNEYIQAINIDETFFWPYRGLIHCLRNTDTSSNIESFLKKGLSIYPNDAGLLVELMAELKRKDKNEEAALYLKKLGSLDNYFFNNIAFDDLTLFLEKDNFNEAKKLLYSQLNTLEESHAKDKDICQAYLSLAILFEMEFEESENFQLLQSQKECYLEMLKINPDSISACRGLVKIYLRLDEYQSARKYADQLGKNICSTDFYKFCLELSKNAENTKNRLRPFKWCIELFPYEIKAYIFLSSIYISTGDIELAREQLEAALKIHGSLFQGLHHNIDEAESTLHLANTLLFWEKTSASSYFHFNKIKELYQRCRTDSIKQKDRKFWISASEHYGKFNLEALCRNENSKTLRETITVYEDLIKETSKLLNRKTWIEYCEQLSKLYRDLANIEKNTEHLEHSTKALKSLLPLIPQEDTEAEHWISIKRSIALNLYKLGELTNTSAPTKEAIEIFKETIDKASEQNLEYLGLDISFDLSNAMYDLFTINSDPTLLMECIAINNRLIESPYKEFHPGAWQGMGKSEFGLAEIQNNVDLAKESLQAFKKAVSYYEGKESILYPYNLQCMSSVMMFIADYDNDPKALREAESALNKAIPFYAPHGDNFIRECLVKKAICLGKIYILGDYKEFSKLDEAIATYEKAMSYFCDKTTKSYAFNLFDIGLLYKMKGENTSTPKWYDSALENLRSARKLFENDDEWLQKTLDAIDEVNELINGLAI